MGVLDGLGFDGFSEVHINLKPAVDYAGDVLLELQVGSIVGGLEGWKQARALVLAGVAVAAPFRAVQGEPVDELSLAWFKRWEADRKARRDAERRR